MIKLIAFLGNYGEKYRRTRHNSAWIFAEHFLPNLAWQSKFRGEVFSCERSHLRGAFQFCDEASSAKPCDNAEKIFFLRPMTLMNLSGESIGELANFYKIAPSEILVVHDELELPFGTVSLKFSGGLGGHNGLRSTKACLASADFWRLRLGIGRPENPDIAAYVLSDFLPQEKARFDAIFSQLSPLLQSLIFFEPEAFLDKWKKRNLIG